MPRLDRTSRIAAVRRRTAAADHAAAVRDQHERVALRDRIVGLQASLVPEAASYSAATLGAGSELRVRLLGAVQALDHALIDATNRTEQTSRQLARQDRRLEIAEDRRLDRLRKRATRQDEHNAELAGLARGNKQ